MGKRVAALSPLSNLWDGAVVGVLNVLVWTTLAVTPCASDAPPPELERYTALYVQVAALNPELAPGDLGFTERRERAFKGYRPLHPQTGDALQELLAVKRAGVQALEHFLADLDGTSNLHRVALDRARTVQAEVDAVVAAHKTWTSLDVNNVDALDAFLSVFWRYGSSPHVLSPLVDWTGLGHPLPGQPLNREAFLQDHCVGPGSAIRDLLRWPGGAEHDWELLVEGLTLPQAQQLSRRVHQVLAQEEQVAYLGNPNPRLKVDRNDKTVTIIRVRQAACLMHSHTLEKVRRSWVIKGSVPCSCPDHIHQPTPQQWEAVRQQLLHTPQR